MIDNMTNIPDIDNVKEKTYHRILHSFKPEIIVPVAAITNNVDFIINDRNYCRMVKTSDNIECVVEEFSMVHMCQLEEDIKKLYGMEPWAYVMRWFKVVPNMYSMEFCKVKLKKYEK